jgi:hypothetical protein
MSSRLLFPHPHTLNCPAARPAIERLRETWRSLSGVETPCSAQLLLADDQEGSGFGRCQDHGALQLGTRMRVATLGTVYRGGNYHRKWVLAVRITVIFTVILRKP